VSLSHPAAVTRVTLVRRLRAPRALHLLYALDDASGRTLLRLTGGRAAIVVEDVPPDAILRGSADAIDALLGGALALDDGLSAGLLATDHLGRARDLAALASACRPSPRPPGPPASARPAALPVGEARDHGAAVVQPDHMLDYSEATDDPSVAYRGSDAVAPPLFHARLMRDALFALMQHPGLAPDFSRLLHVGYDVHATRPLRPWDVLQVRSVLDHAAQKGAGLLLSGRLVGLVAGEAVIEAHSVFFVPGQQRAAPGVSAGPPPPALPSAPKAPPDHRVDWVMGADQSLRYAAASLDDNPIHLDPAAARAAGHPDVVVHGLCTLARAAQTLLARVAFGDPRGMRRLGARFVAPVFNGQALTTVIWRTPTGAAFEVRGPDGAPVLTHGVATLDP
jgi:acyl dehydratase